MRRAMLVLAVLIGVAAGAGGFTFVSIDFSRQGQMAVRDLRGAAPARR